MMNTTVAAVSTPRGKGGVAMIRISGPETFDVVDRCFVSAAGKPSKERDERRAVYGTVRDTDGETVDTGLVTCFRGPRSYTGEDMAEITCHGGTAVTQAVLEAVLSSGAVMAGPGEFTRRAFAAGKLTLSEAEAVGLLIDADTESRRKMAGRLSRGSLSRRVDGICDLLMNNLSALWAAIDYPEEEVGEEGAQQLGQTIREASARIEQLLDTYRTGHAIVHGVPTVLCGSPNVGKSTLYNALCGENKAIVTDIPGTTRDLLETTVDCGGVTLLLSDTAGLRDSEDPVEAVGVARAREAIERAELIFGLLDASRDEEALETDLETLRQVKERNPGAPMIGLWNKWDLRADVPDTLRKRFGEITECQVELSAKSGEGTDRLIGEVTRLFDSGRMEVSDGALLWNAAQKASLKQALSLLREAEAGLSDGTPVDVLGVLCESALAAVKQTDGRGVSEELVDAIFSRFCVGK